MIQNIGRHVFRVNSKLKANRVDLKHSHIGVNLGNSLFKENILVSLEHVGLGRNVLTMICSFEQLIDPDEFILRVQLVSSIKC